MSTIQLMTYLAEQHVLASFFHRNHPELDRVVQMAEIFVAQQSYTGPRDLSLERCNQSKRRFPNHRSVLVEFLS